MLTQMSRRLGPMLPLLILFVLAFATLVIGHVAERITLWQDRTGAHLRWQQQARALLERLRLRHAVDARLEERCRLFCRELNELVTIYSKSPTPRALVEAVRRAAEHRMRPERPQVVDPHTRTPFRHPAAAAEITLYYAPLGEEAPRLLDGPGLTSAGGKLLQPIMAALLATTRHQYPSPDAGRQLDARCRGMFSEQISFDLLSRHRRARVTPVRIRGRDLHLFWDTVVHQNTPIAIVVVTFPRCVADDGRDGLHTTLLDWTDREFTPFFRLTRPLPAERSNTILLPAAVSTPARRRAFAHHTARIARQASAGTAVEAHGYRWIRDHLSINQRHEVWLVSRIPQGADSARRRVFDLLVLLFAAASCLAFTRVLTHNDLPVPSVQATFALLMLFTAGLPLTLTWVANTRYAAWSLAHREQEHLGLMRQNLEVIETRGENLNARYLERCRRIVRSWNRQVGRSLDDAQLAERLDHLRLGFASAGIPLQAIMVSRPRCAPQASISPENPPDLASATISYFDQVSQGTFDDLLTLCGTATRRIGSTQSALMSQLLLSGSGDLIVTHAFRTRNALELISFNGRNTYKYAEFLTTHRQYDAFMFAIWMLDQAYRRVLAQAFAQLTLDEPTRHYAAVEVDHQGVHPLYPPREMGFWGTRTGRSLLAALDPLRPAREVALAMPDHLMTVQPSRLVERVLLVGVTPRAAVSTEVGRFYRGVSALLLTLATLTAALGFLVFRRLILPIRRMEEGLRIVSSGNLSVQLDRGGDDELAFMTRAFDDMIRGLQERRHLGRFVSATLDANTVATGDGPVEPRRRRATVLVSDIRSFTTIAEQNPPEAVVGMLNRHLETMATTVQAHGGLVDRFIGDCIVAVFWGLPDPNDHDHTRRALASAQAMMDRHALLDTMRSQAGLFRYRIGIGIASGELMAVMLGQSGARREQVLLGTPLPAAERLEGLSRHGRSTRIIVNAAVAAALSQHRFTKLDNHPEAFELLPVLDPGTP